MTERNFEVVVSQAMGLKRLVFLRAGVDCWSNNHIVPLRESHLWAQGDHGI